MLEPTKLLLLAQIIIQIILISIVVFFIIIEKKRKIPTNVLEELKSIIKETQNLSSKFSNQVQEKIIIVNRLMQELDTKIIKAETLINEQVKDSVEKVKARKYTQSDIIKMYKGGFEPKDIAQITGIPLGEVELMIKVKEQNDS